MNTFFAIHRIKAIILRNLFRYKNNFMNNLETIFWPAINIIIWGTTSIWFAKNNASIPNLTLAMTSGFVFWDLTLGTISGISIGMLDEIHEKSLLSLFTTPLTIAEWIVGNLITSSLRALTTTAICSMLVFFLYACNIFSIGWMLFPFALSLIVSGWTIGLFGAGLIIYFGHKVQGLPWMLPWLFAPFSAVFYPLNAMPEWMRVIGYCLPTSYIFEGMRSILFTNTMPWNFLVTSFFLNIIYLTGSIIFFVGMFKKSKALGLARL